jgi:hypothetical protein
MYVYEHMYMNMINHVCTYKYIHVGVHIVVTDTWHTNTRVYTYTHINSIYSI